MVSFERLFTVAVALAVSVPIAMAATPAEVVSSLIDMTTQTISSELSKRQVPVAIVSFPTQVSSSLTNITSTIVTDLQPTVDQLAQGNGLISFAPVVDDLSTVTKTTTTVINLFDNVPPLLSEDDSTAIIAATNEFTQSLEPLLTSLTATVPLLMNNPLTGLRFAKVITVLRNNLITLTTLLREHATRLAVMLLKFSQVTKIIDNLIPGLLETILGSGELPIIGGPVSRIMRGAEEFAANLDVAIKA